MVYYFPIRCFIDFVVTVKIFVQVIKSLCVKTLFFITGCWFSAVDQLTLFLLKYYEQAY